VDLTILTRNFFKIETVDFRNRIIKFEPNRVWRTYQGGKVLDSIEGKQSSEDSHFPEDWIGSVTEARNPGREKMNEGLSFVRDSDGNGILFRDIVCRDPVYFLGENGKVEGRMDALPLVKYLDSATRLHFQVHPTATFARERLNCNRGKTEAYVILAIREDIEYPYIYTGFQRPPPRDQLKQWILDQNIEAIENCFTRIPVKPGDVFIIPGGRPHALGEGILMLEIMEASDLAVRFEFERDGFEIPEEARFMGQDIETALDVFNFEPVVDDAIDATFRCEPRLLEAYGPECRFEELIGINQTPCFAVRRSLVSGEIEKSVNEGFIGIVTEGEGRICIENNDTVLNRWDRFFCPAGVGSLQYSSKQGMTVVECYSGKH
jgi:mannose-6-phosphate isomerase